MFSSGANYSKLKTNLRLAINRLKLLEKKKTELALKARKEIADYITTGKSERAKIRVEHIIREDYLVEAMEVTEMYCDLLLARFGLIQQMKDLDEGLAEAISSLIWVAPRLQTDVAELKLIADQLALKYGKPYAQACREQAVGTISEKLVHKLSVQAPPKVLVEKYLVEIAKNYNIEYEADPQLMRESEWDAEDPLISLSEDKKNGGGGATGFGGGSSSGGGGMCYPPLSQEKSLPFSYPQKGGMADPFNLPNIPGEKGAYPPPADLSADPPPGNHKYMGGVGFASPAPGFPPGPTQMGGLDDSPPPPYSSAATAPPHTSPTGGIGLGGVGLNFPPDVPPGNIKETGSPTPAPRTKLDLNSPDKSNGLGFNLPDLPNVPDLPSSGGGDTGVPPGSQDSSNDIDFEDLNKRFEQLKKKK